MEPVPQESLNNPWIVHPAGRCGLISRSARLSDEEKVPTAQIIIRPEGEAVPERAQRVRSARSTAGRDPGAGKRLCGSRQPHKEDGLCPCLNNPESRSDATSTSPCAITVSPYAPTDETRNGFIRARSHNRRPIRRPCGLNNEPDAGGRSPKGISQVEPIREKTLITLGSAVSGGRRRRRRSSGRRHPSIHPVKVLQRRKSL